MEKKKLETRAYNFDVLAEQDEEKGSIITGRPIVYDSVTDLGWFDEVIERGALDKADLTDVRFLVNHDLSKIPLARSRRNNGNSTMQLTVDCYYDLNKGMLAWSDELSVAIADAGYVVCLSNLPAGIDALQDSDPRVQGVTRALREAHKAGAKFVLLSDNIPADSARYPDADAIVCAYLSAGFDVDPITGSGSENMRAINANVPAALCAIFGQGDMPGALPIDVYALAKDADGRWAYTDEVLYARGSGA